MALGTVNYLIGAKEGSELLMKGERTEGGDIALNRWCLEGELENVQRRNKKRR